MASGPLSPLPVSENGTNYQTGETEEKLLSMANSFVSMMDSDIGWAPHTLHEDAVMDWFGRFLRGRSSIIYFLRSHIRKTRHVIESVMKIPPISHRLLQVKDTRKSRRVNVLPLERNEPSTEECGQGDCKGLSTPENAVLPNLKEMIKAPRIKRPVSSRVDCEHCEFLEIQGKLEFESGESMLKRGNDKLERIVLAYTDQIHLIVYEAKNICRKKLFS